DVTDPMSGFFMLRREVIERIAPNLCVEGFKVLVGILTSARGELRVCELSYGFRARMHGSTKLDSRVALDFLGLLVSKATGNVIPAKAANAYWRASWFRGIIGGLQLCSMPYEPTRRWDTTSHDD